MMVLNSLTLLKNLSMLFMKKLFVFLRSLMNPLKQSEFCCTILKILDLPLNMLKKQTSQKFLVNLVKLNWTFKTFKPVLKRLLKPMILVCLNVLYSFRNNTKIMLML